MTAQAPSTEAERHDQLLLGIEAGASMVDVQRALERTPALCWLRAQLGSVEPAELYFGNLTQRLHSALLDDPGPRRSEVKTLLQQLLAWIEFAEVPGIVIDRPRHSQRVRLHDRPDLRARRQSVSLQTALKKRTSRRASTPSHGRDDAPGTSLAGAQSDALYLQRS